MKILLSLILCFLTTGFYAHAQEKNDDFKKLQLLVGTWKMPASNGMLYESWQRKNDSVFSGRSYKVNGIDTLLLEQVDLIKKGVHIQYIPVATGQNNNKPVAFTLLKVENDIYTFENGTHDFPQRIVYVLPQNNSMHAWIEGEVNGKFRKIEYNYISVH